MSPDTLLYHFSRTIVRFSLQFYCKRLSFEGLENIPKDKAILFCGTHANSFLDALKGYLMMGWGRWMEGILLTIATSIGIIIAMAILNIKGW